jgi:hypothetical protein
MGFPWLAAAVMGTGVISAFGTLRAGQAAKVQSELQAEQMKIDRDLNKVTALQQRNQRLEDYYTARASNDAIFAYMGQDNSTSVEAFKKAQAQTVGQDVGRIEFQTTMQSSARTVQSRLEVLRGQNALRASKINALSTLTSSAYQAYGIK